MGWCGSVLLCQVTGLPLAGVRSADAICPSFFQWHKCRNGTYFERSTSDKDELRGSPLMPPFRFEYPKASEPLTVSRCCVAGLGASGLLSYYRNYGLGRLYQSDLGDRFCCKSC